jgi:hypothetical protein
MPAKNNITNDSLISKPFSSAYGDGWDKIYLKTPQEWSLICGKNPQNWDEFDSRFRETRMTRKQFETLFENE